MAKRLWGGTPMNIVILASVKSRFWYATKHCKTGCGMENRWACWLWCWVHVIFCHPKNSDGDMMNNGCGQIDIYVGFVCGNDDISSPIRNAKWWFGRAVEQIMPPEIPTSKSLWKLNTRITIKYIILDASTKVFGRGCKIILRYGLCVADASAEPSNKMNIHLFMTNGKMQSALQKIATTKYNMACPRQHQRLQIKISHQDLFVQSPHRHSTSGIQIRIPCQICTYVFTCDFHINIPQHSTSGATCATDSTSEFHIRIPHQC